MRPANTAMNPGPASGSSTKVWWGPVLLVLVASFAWASPDVPSPAPAHELVLADVGFRFEVPATWNLQKPDSGPFAAVAELPPKQALALLTRTPIGPDEPEGKGLDDLLAELPKPFSEYEILAQADGLHLRLLLQRSRVADHLAPPLVQLASPHLLHPFLKGGCVRRL